ncbi:MAG: hypothetical protein ACREXO_13780, partial [Advenella sp.]
FLTPLASRSFFATKTQQRAEQAIENTANKLRLTPLFVPLMPLFTVKEHPCVVFASIRRQFFYA